MATHTSTGSPTLLLFPTELERRRFADQGGIEPGFALVAQCGFGPVAAAAQTARLLSALRPARVVLIGIAGAYDDEDHPVGSAAIFTRVAVDGIGAGRGATFQPASRLGFPQWPATKGAPAIEDALPLTAPSGTAPALLLTTCAASDSRAQAAERLDRHPDAVAEDMEGFAVALACALQGVPVTIVRGMSNRVGERDPSRWNIPAALAAARRLLLELLGLLEGNASGEAGG